MCYDRRQPVLGLRQLLQWIRPMARPRALRPAGAITAATAAFTCSVLAMALLCAASAVRADEDQSLARLVAPALGTVLRSSTIVFSWTSGAAVTRYRLAVGTSAAAVSAPPWADLFYYEGTNTSATVTRLPKDGSTVYVRLWSETVDGWRYNDYALATALVVENPATLLEPSPGSTLSPGSVNFRWSPGDGVTSYRLAIGTSAEVVAAAPWADLFFYEGTNTSALVSGLPDDGSTVFVRLWSLIDGVWSTVDYSLVAPLLRAAEILSPVPGATLTSFTQRFAWNPGIGATEYMLGVGTSLASVSEAPWGDVYAANVGVGVNSSSVPGIPRDGGSLYVRLGSRVAGTWRFRDYVYGTASTGAEPVAIIAPAPGSTLSAKTVQFAWSASEPVEMYRLAIATDPAALAASPWANVHYSQGPETSRSVSGIPLDGNLLFVRLWFRTQGRWFSRDYPYGTVAVVPAEMIAPTPGSRLTRSDVTFRWSPGSGADSFALSIATSAEVLDSSPHWDIDYYQGTATAAAVPAIPLTGRDVHVRLWSRFGTDWYSRDYQFPTSNDIPGPGTYDRAIVRDELVRGYRLHVPVGYDSQTPLPLLIALHGNEGTAAEMEQLTRFSALADQERFIVLYPEAAVENQRIWYDGRDDSYPVMIDEVGFIAGLLDLVRNTLAVDERRVYVTGFSGGAWLANALGAALPSRITAIAPVAGTFTAMTARTVEPERPMPVMYLHGTQDPLAYYYDGGSAGTGKGASMPAMDLVTWWAGKNRVLVNETIGTTDAAQDGTRLVTHTFRNTGGTALVVFHSIEDGGHTWPGGLQWDSEAVIGRTSAELDASRAIWNFFRGFSLDSPALAPFTGLPFAWPPVWRGAPVLACQWSRRALARRSDAAGGMGYGEDSYTTYLQWAFPVGLPEGTKITLVGDFPYARYFDIQVSPPWDPEYPAWRGGRGAQPVAILDQDIEPFVGSVNPYRPGADRRASNRRYAVVFELRSAPAGEWNTLNGGAVTPPYRGAGAVRVGGHRSGRYGELGPYIEMRIALPDGGNPYAGVAPPVVLMQLPGEAPVFAPPIAELYRYPRGDENEAYWVKLPYAPEDNECLANGWAAKDQSLHDLREDFVASMLAEPPEVPGPVDPRSVFFRAEDGSLRQFKVFGVARHACVMQKVQEEGLAAARESCPAADLDLYGRGPREPVPKNDEHTNGLDMYNAYLASVVSPYPGEVLVFRGRAPATPRTFSGPAAADMDTPVRYWSLCTYKDGVVRLNCVADEAMAVGADDYYTIVICRPEDRPINATSQCRMTLLPLLAPGANTLWRMKSTRASTWEYALQKVPWELGDLALETYDETAVRRTMGEYYPDGRYMSRANVEALGCDPDQVPWPAAPP